MRIQEILEDAVRLRAGIIPYVIKEDGSIEMFFMIPSHPAYGGTKPQIAKGGVDHGETSQQAAIREGGEELGLIPSNIEMVTLVKRYRNTGYYTGETDIDVYIAKVKTQSDFNEPHFETGSTHWLTVEEFNAVGREKQIGMVNDAHKKMKALALVVNDQTDIHA